jgi:ankyrin repeat protein
MLDMIDNDAEVGSSDVVGASDPSALPPLPSQQRLQQLLFDAARMGRDDVIPALLQAGAELEEGDGRDHTALILASYNGRESTTALLLSLGARPDGLPAATTNSALMGVAFKGHAAIARVLLTAGADANYANGVGQTALMMAALFDRRAIIDLLLASGADATLRDAAGNSAASVADAQGNGTLAHFLSERA